MDLRFCSDLILELGFWLVFFLSEFSVLSSCVRVKQLGFRFLLVSLELDYIGFCLWVCQFSNLDGFSFFSDLIREWVWFCLNSFENIQF